MGLTFLRQTLEGKLIREGKTRWLDVGCGTNFQPGFIYLDAINYDGDDVSIKEKYFTKSILELTDNDIELLGDFDLVRMQHVFEHFAMEEGQIALRNAARLIKPGGLLLITVPDLKLFVKYYRKNRFNSLFQFYHWALNRVDKESPPSFFFSIFAHNLVHEKHNWCYDYEGLNYVIEKSGLFVKIRKLKITDKLASVPFTHNRPLEDVCIMAMKK